MSEIVKLRQRGQMTLPKQVRDRLDVGEGDYLEVELDGARMIMRPARVVTYGSVEAGMLERRAEEQITAGKYRSFHDPDELMASLDWGDTHDLEANEVGEGLEPQRQAEQTLAAIWEELLGVESVDVDDNFFTLGGDSILALSMTSRAAEKGLALTLRQVLQRPTIAGLAHIVTRKGESSRSPDHGEASDDLTELLVDRAGGDPQAALSIWEAIGEALAAQVVEEKENQLVTEGA